MVTTAATDYCLCKHHDRYSFSWFTYTTNKSHPPVISSKVIGDLLYFTGTHLRLEWTNINIKAYIYRKHGSYGVLQLPR